jgi:catechol 2,3-dioxygenase-like lactoylglutathione lyase family enzyme
MQLTFDAIFYYTADLERAVAFYRDVLGLRLASLDCVGRFDMEGVLFELVPGEVKRGDSNARLCLRTGDIAAARQELLAKRVKTSEIERKSNGTLLRFEDPDGNEVCLWQYE